jgi:ectoine hydroxylase-related dioxygenase (phytanoyl-CoA dioxygenase family)
MCVWLQDVVERVRGIPATFEPEFEVGTDVVRKVRRLFWNDEPFWSHVFASVGLPALAEQLIGSPVALTFHASFLKAPRVGTPVALHQDQALWKYDYPKAISIWVALTSAKRHNGCVVGCPGSHARGGLPHVAIANHPWHRGVDWSAEKLAEPIQYELDAGDVLVWDRYFVHGSGPNLSTDPRWGVVMVFIDRMQPQLRTTDRADF